MMRVDVYSAFDNLQVRVVVFCCGHPDAGGSFDERCGQWSASELIPMERIEARGWEACVSAAVELLALEAQVGLEAPPDRPWASVWC